MPSASAQASFRQEWKRIAVFLAILYSVTYFVQFVIWYSGGLEGRMFRILAPITMLFPGISLLFN